MCYGRLFYDYLWVHNYRMRFETNLIAPLTCDITNIRIGVNFDTSENLKSTPSPSENNVQMIYIMKCMRHGKLRFVRQS